MARKTKPCAFCEEEHWHTEDERNGHQLHLEIYPFSGVIAVTSFAKDEDGETTELYMRIEMNYCPVCGRKLGY
jgi:hypothetical protein